MVLRKDELEASLNEEKKLIETGKLKEDNPLDFSEYFAKLCSACRKGDLKACQEAITDGVNINARDEFDYTPLILASLCGHYEIVQLLLESGALCERDTFQGKSPLHSRGAVFISWLTESLTGERCLYNALNDKIRNLLLSYDYSKSSDPLQPLSSHISSLLAIDQPQTSDIVVTSATQSFNLHKFVLAARSPYFRTKLNSNPEIVSWRLPPAIPPQAFEVAIRYIYFGDLPSDVGGGPGTGYSEEEVLEGIDRLSKQLEIQSLWDGILDINDRRIARQNRSDETKRGRDQLDLWFRENVIKHKIVVESSKAGNVKWTRDNSIFSDVLLCAEDDSSSADEPTASESPTAPAVNGSIPSGLFPSNPSRSPSRSRTTSTVFPVHRAMLLRSEYFNTMFSSTFAEAQETPYLNIITVDCASDVLEAVLAFIYTERTDFPLEIAVDVLFAADLLFIEKLKAKAAVVISTLGSGALPSEPSKTEGQDFESGQVSIPDADPLDPFTILRAAWLLRVPRLEEFVARYLAHRLERYIDLPEFAELIKESASRIQAREETDSIELIDDIRYYLSERFRLRFEGEGIEELLGDDLQDDEVISSAEVGKAPSSLSDGIAQVKPLDRSNVAQTTNDTYESRLNGVIRTLDGEDAGDEFARDALDYQILLGKIELLLDKLQLDA